MKLEIPVSLGDTRGQHEVKKSVGFGIGAPSGNEFAESLAGCALHGSREAFTVVGEGGGPGAAQRTHCTPRARGPAAALALLPLAVEPEANCLPFSALISQLLNGFKAVSLSKIVIKEGLQAYLTNE